ncbi:261_t:CDS:2, partial [Ambispora gerdemannii]
MTKTDKNNFPPYAEELTLNQGEQLNIQQILTQLKQSIPVNFIPIELQEGNYCGSTNPKWKDKPLSERYGLEKGQDINQPVYIDPEVLLRKASFGGITIESEAEIILVNPNKVLVKEIETQTKLTSKEISKQRGVAGCLLDILNYWGTYYKNFLTEYDDGKEFMNFLIPSDKDSCNYVYNILVKGSEEEKELAKEFNKLLQDYRKNPTEGM